ncbi:MAG: FlgD immunoglobulin-like domain containing protein [Candidatus Eiseniibacteriota bacterium]
MADNQNLWTGPVYVTYEPGSTTAVGDRPTPGIRLSAHPSPTSAGLTVEFDLPRDDAGSLALYDLSGRRVRVLLDGPLTAGPHTVTWDGLAEDGARPRAGIFFLRLVTGAGRVERKVLLLN